MSRRFQLHASSFRLSGGYEVDTILLMLALLSLLVPTGRVCESSSATALRPLGGSVRDGGIGLDVRIICTANERQEGAKHHEGSTFGVDIVWASRIRIIVCAPLVRSVRLILCVEHLLV